MATERDVECPHCGATRRTKAARSTRISCLSCGELFPAPQPPAPTGDEAGVAPDPGSDPAPTPAAQPGGVKVERATSTTVKQKARPRSHTAPGGPSAEPAEPEVEPEPLPRHAHPQTAVAKRAGRRGGRAV
jgi:ribosomal protein S27E